MPTERSDLLQWSAPCFVKLGMTGVGVSFGAARIASFMACLTPTLREDLIKNGGRSFGGVDTAVVVGSQVVPTADFAPGKGAAYGLAGGNKRTGFVFDLSVEVGSLSVDQDRNHAVYGAEATAEALLSGRVPPPAGMQQLYGRIGGIVNKLERVSAAPSLTRSSLDRATLGECPAGLGGWALSWTIVLCCALLGMDKGILGHSV